MADPLVDLLQASLQEQTAVTVHLRSGRVAGVVARLDQDTVEVRSGGERTVVRLAAVDAVTAS